MSTISLRCVHPEGSIATTAAKPYGLYMPLIRHTCCGDSQTLLSAPLDAFQAAGWVVIVCFGALFALLAILLVWIDVKFSGVIYNSEQVQPPSVVLHPSLQSNLTHT